MPFSKISYENIQDYLRWIVPGFVTLFLLFDILPESFKKAEILLPLGIILSIFIYAITHLLSHTETKDYFCNGFGNFCIRIIKFFTVGRSYEKHIKDVTEKFKKKNMEKTKEREAYNSRQLFELYKICQDKNLPKHHESAHRYTSFYWLFSCSALAVLISIPLRFFIRYYNYFSNSPALKLEHIDWRYLFSFEKVEFCWTDILLITISFLIIIIFRCFANRFANRTTEVDIIIIDII